MAHPGWPWVDEATAVALHKGNVYWEMSGWAPKHFPGNLKVDMAVDMGGTNVQTFVNVAVGYPLPLQVTRIYATGTTATNIVALY